MSDQEPLEALRAAAARLDSLEGPDAPEDPAEHAARFEAVHEALTAALADVDGS